MRQHAVSISPSPINPELLDLFAKGDREIAGGLVLMVQKSTYPLTYNLVERTIKLAPECDRMLLLGFVMLNVVGQEDEATQVARALEIHEAARFENLAELVSGLNPEDRQLGTMPPDPATLLGQEGLHALNGLTRFILKQAYKRAPEEQKVLYAIRIHNLLGTNGAVRQLLGALQIYFHTYRGE